MVDGWHIVSGDLLPAHLLQNLASELTTLAQPAFNYLVAFILHRGIRQIDPAPVAFGFHEYYQDSSAMHPAYLHKLLVLAPEVGRLRTASQHPRLLNPEHAAVFDPQSTVSIRTGVIEKEKTCRCCAPSSILDWLVEVRADNHGCVNVEVLADVLVF